MLITKTIEIEMGHRIPLHKSKCRSLHGHRYVIDVCVEGEVKTEQDSNEGMVMDFSDLKDIMKTYIDDVYDHSFTMYIMDNLVGVFGTLQKEQYMKINFVGFIPTAENLAKHWYYCLRGPLQKVGIRIKTVTVWETSTSSAIYEESEFNG